jgi:hypothetical protein
MPDFQSDPGPAQYEAGLGYIGAFQLCSVASGLTASKTHTQSGAFKINAMLNTFSTVANANDAAVLPPSFPGMSIAVINSDGNSMQVYATGSDTIQGIAGSTGVSQMANSTVFYQCTAAGAWTAPDLGVGTTGNYPTQAYQNGLVAGTTHSAAGGMAITSSIAEFDTVANTGDAATLPPAKAGMQVVVINNGANSLTIYAATALLGGVSGGDTINGTTSFATSSISLPPVVVIAFCTKNGAWLTK